MIKYINNKQTTTLNKSGEVQYITFKNYEAMDYITHGFSTRIGGVSEEIYESMNLSFNRGDDMDKVKENFARIGQTLHINTSDMIYSMQTHTTNVIEATENMKGYGIINAQKLSDVDGFVTNKPGICLVTSYADCVPLFMVDKAIKAIGLSHSGWRGTIGNIAQATINKMVDIYGSNPQDIDVFIGPSICQNCYEVSADVAEQFMTQYERLDVVIPEPNIADKYLLDLHKANYINFIRAGVPEENIMVTDICTCCNPGLLFSHRASKGQRGGMCGFLMLK